MYDANEKEHTVKFNGGTFKKAEKEGSFLAKGDRVTKLGTNMYVDFLKFKVMW